MRDAYGGIVNIVFVVLFLLILSGILGLIVSYTKAFKMKNNVISVIEQYEGSGCVSSITGDSACRTKIREGAKRLSYAPISLKCPSDYTKIDNLYCVKEKLVSGRTTNHNAKYIYSVITQVDINMPLVSRIFGFNFFQVNGDTQEVEKPS